MLKIYLKYFLLLKYPVHGHGMRHNVASTTIETRADRRGSLNLRRLKMQIPSICLRESRDVGRRSSSVRYEKGLEKRSTRGKHARRQSRGISLINPNRLSTSCRRASLGSDPLARATITKRSFPLSILSSFSCVSVAPPRWSTTRTIIF